MNPLGHIGAVAPKMPRDRLDNPPDCSDLSRQGSQAHVRVRRLSTARARRPVRPRAPALGNSQPPGRAGVGWEEARL